MEMADYAHDDYYICPEEDDFKIVLEHQQSKSDVLSISFKKEAKKQLPKLLKIILGDNLNLKRLFICFQSHQLHVPNSAMTEVICSVMFHPPYSFRCILIWENINGQDHIDYKEEIDPNSIRFSFRRLEGEYLQSIIDDVNKFALAIKKKYIEGYRFVVQELYLTNDFKMKIIFKEDYTKECYATLEQTISDACNEYNNESLKENEEYPGLIHGFSIKKKVKKNAIVYLFDIGTAVFGMNYILKKIDQTNLDIVKIVVGE
ncbi:MAG: hypothetical protein KAX81_06500 [Leadbetterella sp.]|nr:hypothetical protein [Leadbetterella sp.]